MIWKALDPLGHEANKVKFEVVPYTRGKGVDLGCGPEKAFPHFIGVDSCKDTELFGIPMKPDVVVDTCEKLPYADGEMDFAFSSHLLEHIQDYQGALKEWRRILKVGGYLVLYLPHKDLYPNVGTPHANPDHRHDFTQEQIVEALSELGGWDFVMCEKREERQEYSFLVVAQKRNDWQQNNLYRKKRPEKTVCVVRYGGFGDMLQTSAILPALKREGYHITVMTTPKGQDILRDDPHIDGFFLQDQDQVPNGWLGAHWESNARRYDKFVNLSESVEVGLLFQPGVSRHKWPQPARHMIANVNYGELTAAIAEVPYENRVKFYPTAKEAADTAKMVGQRFIVMWVLAGSSVHKFYPWMDHTIRRVLDELPDARLVFVGASDCKILEQGWENEKRILCMSGEIGIRETLALSQKCAVVVGPETGVLNCVAYEPNAKVVFLSHSSHENLTKHWLNTTVLTGVASCYPCHQLHYGNQFCPTHEETGAAMCQVTIDPDHVFEAIAGTYRVWNLRRAA